MATELICVVAGEITRHSGHYRCVDGGILSER